MKGVKVYSKKFADELNFHNKKGKAGVFDGMKDRYATTDTNKSTGNIMPDMFEISSEQATWFSKQIFIDTSTLKMH